MAAITVTQGNIIAGAVTHLDLNSTSLGPTSGGLRYRKEQTWTDIPVDQLKAIVKKLLNLTKFFVTTTLAELTLENAQIAWSEPDSDMTGTSVLYATTNELGEKQLVFKGEAPNDLERTVTMLRAIALGAGETAYTTDAGAVIPVEWECLMDGTTEKFGSITDLAAA